MARLLVVIGWLAGAAGCVVGPQDDFPDNPGPNGAEDPARGADGDADADADADEDAAGGGEGADAGPPPNDETGYPDDGADGAFDAESQDADPSIDDLQDPLVPGVPPIPRPGVRPIAPRDPDLAAQQADPGVPPGFGIEGGNDPR